MSIQAIIEGVIGKEGRFSDHPADRGGPTCWGITEVTARANGYTGSMRDMPRELAVKIYLNQYVTKPGFLQIAAISLPIAEELVDTGVNCGPALPSKWLQRTLNALNLEGKLYPDLVVDGEAGAATRSALIHLLNYRKTDGERVILKTLNCLQGAYYLDITEKREKNKAFFFGWLMNRVEIA